MPAELVRFVVDSEEFYQELFDQSSVADGATVESEEATFTLRGHSSTKQFGTEIVISVAVAIGEKVVVEPVAEWLFKKIRRSTRHIRYGGATYDVDIAGISRLLKRLKADQRHS